MKPPVNTSLPAFSHMSAEVIAAERKCDPKEACVACNADSVAHAFATHSSMLGAGLIFGILSAHGRDPVWLCNRHLSQLQGGLLESLRHVAEQQAEDEAP